MTSTNSPQLKIYDQQSKINNQKSKISRNPPSISPLYARFLSRQEKASLRRVSIEDLTSEINLLRVLAAYLMEFQQSSPANLQSRISALRTCVVLIQQLAILVRWHCYGSDTLIDEDIQAVLLELGQDWSAA